MWGGGAPLSTTSCHSRSVPDGAVQTVSPRTSAPGSILVYGTITDNPGIGNKLSFATDHVEQDSLASIVASLERLETHYPVVGSANDA